MWYYFVKVGHSDQILLGVTCSCKVHALMEFQKFGSYEKRDMGLALKTELVVHF